MNKETVEIINQLVDVMEKVQHNASRTHEALKLMDKKLDVLQAENVKLKEELEIVKKTVKSIWKFT